ncbi:MAG: group 1 truncated hemoglobin [Halobacteriovoraceae bacterium]|nr:group 1 truncated hemoglobin [Halobacteriovoraceae bacterium]
MANDNQDEKLKEFERLGGKPMLQKISKILYDKLFAHEWLSQYFVGIKQESIEAQQVDFMTGALGGGNIYCGKLPIPAHKHMMISDELFNLRAKILAESIDEAGASAELKERWLKIDEAFRGGIVKKSVSECQKRFNSDEILDFPNPKKSNAA